MHIQQLKRNMYTRTTSAAPAAPAAPADTSAARERGKFRNERAMLKHGILRLQWPYLHLLPGCFRSRRGRRGPRCACSCSARILYTSAPRRGDAADGTAARNCAGFLQPKVPSPPLLRRFTASMMINGYTGSIIISMREIS